MTLAVLESWYSRNRCNVYTWRDPEEAALLCRSRCVASRVCSLVVQNEFLEAVDDFFRDTWSRLTAWMMSASRSEDRAVVVVACRDDVVWYPFLPKHKWTDNKSGSKDQLLLRIDYAEGMCPPHVSLEGLRQRRCGRKDFLTFLLSQYLFASVRIQTCSVVLKGIIETLSRAKRYWTPLYLRKMKTCMLTRGARPSHTVELITTFTRLSGGVPRYAPCQVLLRATRRDPKSRAEDELKWIVFYDTCVYYQYKIM